MNVSVDLVVTVKHQPSAHEIASVKALVGSLTICRRSRRVWDHLSAQPYQVTSRRGLADVDLSRTYDCVWLDGECCLSILKNKSLRAAGVAVRINNDEARYFRELGDARGLLSPAGVYYRLESLKFRALWPTVDRLSGGRLYFASCDEWRRYAEAGGATFARWLPPPLPLDEAKPCRSGVPGAVLFVGSLFMPNNVAGIRWYLEQVHARITHPNYTLTIAGNGRGANVPQLEGWVRQWPNCKLVLSPDSDQLRELYARASVFVNPMQHGAGITLKTAHALLAGLPVVSTRIGTAGSGLIPGEHIQVAEDAADFAVAVDAWLEAPQRAAESVDRAQAFLCARFDHQRNLTEVVGEWVAPSEPVLQ